MDWLRLGKALALTFAGLCGAAVALWALVLSGYGFEIIMGTAATALLGGLVAQIYHGLERK